MFEQVKKKELQSLSENVSHLHLTINDNAYLNLHQTTFFLSSPSSLVRCFFTNWLSSQLVQIYTWQNGKMKFCSQFSLCWNFWKSFDFDSIHVIGKQCLFQTFMVPVCIEAISPDNKTASSQGKISAGIHQQSGLFCACIKGEKPFTQFRAGKMITTWIVGNDVKSQVTPSRQSAITMSKQVMILCSFSDVFTTLNCISVRRISISILHPFRSKIGD